MKANLFFLRMTLCGLAILWIAFAARGQVTDQSMQIGQHVLLTMYNGEEYRGQVEEVSDGKITLTTANGSLQLIMVNIEKFEIYDPSRPFIFQNPNETRYFFGASAIPLETNEGYYQNTMLTFNFVNVGVTDNFSIGGGLELISTLVGSPIWFLTPKLGFQVAEKGHAGAGLLFAGFAGEGSVVVPYGIYTHGGADSNVSFGVGYGWANGDASPGPTITLNGMHRVSNQISLMTENYLLPKTNGATYLGIQGVRLLTRKSSFDIGALLTPLLWEDTTLPLLPFVGYIRYF